MVEVYAGLDVSDKSTHVCVMDGSGAVLWAGACATDPEVIAKTLKSRAPGLARVVLETGPLSTFLNYAMSPKFHSLAEIQPARRHLRPGSHPSYAVLNTR